MIGVGNSVAKMALFTIFIANNQTTSSNREFFQFQNMASISRFTCIKFKELPGPPEGDTAFALSDKAGSYDCFAYYGKGTDQRYTGINLGANCMVCCVLITDQIDRL